MTEPQSSPNDLACQRRLIITASISSTDGWTSTDLTALYGPEGLAVFLTWHVERMALVRRCKSGCPIGEGGKKLQTAVNSEKEQQLRIISNLLEVSQGEPETRI